MLTFPKIDPVIFALGPLQVRWYGLMYVIGFVATYLLVRKQITERRMGDLAVHFENLNVALLLSVVVGGRLGYVLFYNLPYYFSHPAEIAATWQGGMSFHGGLVGALAGGFFFCRRNGLSFLQCADLYVVTIPIGLGFGRIGNFINGELFGRTATVPWAMVFPDGGPLPRHPSQLYESFFEGAVLFILLWSLRQRPRPADRTEGVSRTPGMAHELPAGSMLALFLVGYGVLRFGVEFFREPDPQLGFLFSGATMGQLLCLTMIAVGAGLFALCRKWGTAAAA